MIPRWIPQFWVSPHFARQLIERTTELDDYRVVCEHSERPVEIWVRRRWLYYARIEAWYWRRQWWLYHFAARHGILQLKEEGGYFSDGRLSNPKYWFRRRVAPLYGRAPYWGS